VIIDLGAEYNALLQRVIEGGPGSQEAFKELVRHGEHLLQPLMARFPGPLRIDRHRTRGDFPAASQCGAVLELIVAIRRPALPFVTVRLSSTRSGDPLLGDARPRRAALPRGRQRARPRASSTTTPPCAGSPGAPPPRSSTRVPRARPSSRASTTSPSSPDQPTSQRLIGHRGDGRDPRRRPWCRRSSPCSPITPRRSPTPRAAPLLLIARQDFSRDVRRFREWWSRNANRHRVEWLIDALMHEQPSIRRAAGDELKLITKEYFGYYDDLPKRERERAQALYRAWWEREGHLKFS
jgi:hypothetical protein